MEGIQTTLKLTREELAIALQPTRFDILKIVSAINEIGFGNLASLFPKSKSSVSQHVTILEDNEFIERQKVNIRHSPTDPKTKVISTPKGIAFFTDYFGYGEKEFQEVASDVVNQLTKIKRAE